MFMGARRSGWGARRGIVLAQALLFLLSLASEARVQIYAIGIRDRLLVNGTPPAKTNRMAMQLLASIADVTGGRLFAIRDPKMLEDATAKLASNLHSQYLIGYYPRKLVKNGRWRKLKVRVARSKGSPRLIVYARTGYYAPGK